MTSWTIGALTFCAVSVVFVEITARVYVASKRRRK